MDKFLHPIIVALAWVWVQLHALVTTIIPSVSVGVGWVLAIVLLTILVRLVILPLYLKQIKSSRSMQTLQPEIKKIQAKYEGKKDPVSRQRQQEETMALYKEEGASPFASCLPMLVQMPILFGLYRVVFAVQGLADGTYAAGDHLGPLNQAIAQQIQGSTFLGIGLFDSISTVPGAQKAIFVVLIAAMVIFQFLQIRMSMVKNMPPHQDPNNPMVRSQKSMMYMMPAMFIFTGMIFQMALLVYMLTTTIFGLLQQWFVILYLPTPGSPAYAKLVSRHQQKYQKWAAPQFAELATELEGANRAQTQEIDSRALATIKPKAAGFKVDTDFPAGWSDGEQLAALRTLAVEDWKVLPDAAWMKEISKKHNPESEVAIRQTNQPKRLSKAQRRRRAEAERSDADAKARADRKRTQKPAGSNLTPEEIESRRQARRAAERERNKRRRNKRK